MAGLVHKHMHKATYKWMHLSSNVLPSKLLVCPLSLHKWVCLSHQIQQVGVSNPTSLGVSLPILSKSGHVPHHHLHKWVCLQLPPFSTQVGVSHPITHTSGCVPPHHPQVGVSQSISPTSECIPPHHPHTSEGPLLTAAWLGSHLKTSHSSPVWGERGVALSSP